MTNFFRCLWLGLQATLVIVGAVAAVSALLGLALWIVVTMVNM